MEQVVCTHGVPPDEAAIAAIYASIGRQIRVARTDRGWHQSELAERANLSPSVICRLELARRPPNMNQLIVVSGLLARRTSDLFHAAEDDGLPARTSSLGVVINVASESQPL